jgi:hypothetical protein
MKTVSGQLQMTKTEAKNIRLLLEHCLADISYGGEGTYNLSDPDNSPDLKSIQKAKEAIEDIKWILSTSTIK